MAKKSKNQEIDDETELEEKAEDAEETEGLEGEPEPAKPAKKASLFPKKLPASEPSPEPKPRTNELDSVAAKIDELAQKVESVLNPKSPEPKKRDYQLFDEFDFTLENEA